MKEVLREQARCATLLSPNEPAAWFQFGKLEASLSNFSECLDDYYKFIEVSNRSIYSLLTLAEILVYIGQFEKAEILCDEVISRNELSGVAHACKAGAAAGYGNHDVAIDSYKKALETGCPYNESMIKYYLARSLLSVGRWDEGWKYLFTSRIENKSYKPLHFAIRRFLLQKKPLFGMGPPPAVIHIHWDGGYGDNIALMRYLPLLVAKGYTVRYEISSELLKLAKDNLPSVEVMPPATDYPGSLGIPEFDFHLPIIDLPFIFRTKVDTIPWNGPYIKADPELVKKYKPYKGKIGICWTTASSSIRSLPFGLVKPIINADPSAFVSLQVGRARHENDMIADPLPDDDHVTWADTAALVENLDLIIANDSSIPHLAGAMGKPIWLMMNKYLPSWQWMAEYPGASWNTASPWYPSMRVFRQKTRGDWEPVVKDITTELRLI